MITKSELRHNKEIPLLTLGTLLALVLGVAAAAVFVSGRELTALGTTVLFAIFGAPLAQVLMVQYLHWKAASSGVLVTEEQLPELHKIYTDLVKQIGLDEQPNLYVVNGNGTLNAYAAKCTVRKKYVVIYSDIVDTLYDLKDPEIVKVVLAHELGHVHLNHVAIWRVALNIALSPTRLNTSISRAAEYSADRVAGSVSKRTAHSLMMIYGGKRVAKNVSVDEYVKSTVTNKSRFWVPFLNLMSDHAVGYRRIAAADKMDKKGWKNVHGKML